MRIPKKEIQEIFNKHSLNLDFPNKADHGEDITDWSLWYHTTKYENSDLRKFVNIITHNYPQYRFVARGIGGTVSIVYR